MSRKPDFFIVGAPKSGTTSLYNYLMQHPDIFMPVEKEPHFFGSWRQSVSRDDWEEYLRHFEGTPRNILAGEASTSYLYLDSAAEEIKQFQPRAKIIIVLRNPVDRAYSQYWFNIRTVGTQLMTASFEEELNAEETRLREGWRGFAPEVDPPVYYIKSGQYANQVARFLKLFGNESVRVYLFDDLVRDPKSLCRDAFLFLGVNPDYPIQTQRVYNVSGPVWNPLISRFATGRFRSKELMKKVLPILWLRAAKEWVLQRNTRTVPEMNPETRRRLQRVFREDSVYVQELTGRDLSHWLDDPRIEPPQKGTSEVFSG